MELRSNYRREYIPIIVFLNYIEPMKYAKLLGALLLLLHLYLFFETFFWQGPPMPSWRFFLGIFGPLIGIAAGIYLIDSKGK